MSTEITPKALEGKLLVTSFWGGEKDGRCVQLTPTHADAYGGYYAQLTQAEVLDLIVVLLEWTSENMRRKLSGNSAGTTTKGQE